MREVKLILIRRGNTFEEEETARYVGARTDLPLTATGQEQARRVAQYLKKQDLIPQAVVTGLLLRQTQSAEILLEELNIPESYFMSAPELSEIDYGPWENLSADQIRAIWPVAFADWTENGKWPKELFPQHEEQIKKSLDNWLKEASAQQSFDILLAVTSNGILRYIHQLCGPHAHIGPAEAKVRTGGICVVNLTINQRNIVAWNC